VHSFRYNITWRTDIQTDGNVITISRSCRRNGSFFNVERHWHLQQHHIVFFESTVLEESHCNHASIPRLDRTNGNNSRRYKWKRACCASSATRIPMPAEGDGLYYYVFAGYCARKPFQRRDLQVRLTDSNVNGWKHLLQWNTSNCSHPMINTTGYR